MKTTIRSHRGSRRGFVTALTAACICLFCFQNADAQGRRGFSRAGNLRERIDTQQRRIGHGILNGSLTPSEAARLEARESLFVKEVRESRAEHNGHLTAAETVRLNRQANQLSQQIFTQRHDQQFVGTPRSEVNWRENAQRK